MADKVVAVVGSNCFTGSHVVDALLERPDLRVLGVSRSPEKDALFLPYKKKAPGRFEFHRLHTFRDMEKVLELFDARKPFAVINVAGLSEVNLSNFKPLDYFRTNTLAVVELAHALSARDYLKRFIHVSSAEIYGTCSGAIPEDAPLRPSTPYAVSKAAADMYLTTLHKNFGFPVNLARSTNVYGRHQQLFKIIPRSVINLKRGAPIRLEGGGTAVKSFIHIRDVVDGILAILDEGRPGETYHFSTDNRLDIAGVVKRICGLMRRDYASAVTVVGDRLGQDAQYSLDCAKAERELSWRPRVDFDDGLREVIEWIEGSWAEIERQPDQYVHSF
jgi:dTDP-glucose 4,6-dehydratase